MAGQVLFETAEKFNGENLTLGQVITKALDPKTMARLLAILLLREDEIFDPARVQDREHLFLHFPAEDAMEVIEDFFIWNQRLGVVIASTAGALIAAKSGSNTEVPIPTRDTAK